MRKRIALVVVALFGSIAVADATPWPDHGYFYVDRLVMGSSERCELKLELNIQGELFALIFLQSRQNVSPLLVEYMSADKRIDSDDAVSVKIDETEILAFRPVSHTKDADLATVVGSIKDTREIAAAWKRLTNSAAAGKWVRVTTGDVTKEVPADGLQAALADFSECRAQTL